MQQGMVERLSTVFGSLHENLQVLHHLLLSAEVAEERGRKAFSNSFSEEDICSCRMSKSSSIIYFFVLFACKVTKKVHSS